MKIGNIIELSALHFIFRITRFTLHCFSAFLYNSSNDCKIRTEINRMNTILSVGFFVQTRNQKTETHDWIKMIVK